MQGKCYTLLHIASHATALRHQSVTRSPSALLLTLRLTKLQNKGQQKVAQTSGCTSGMLAVQVVLSAHVVLVLCCMRKAFVQRLLMHQCTIRLSFNNKLLHPPTYRRSATSPVNEIQLPDSTIVQKIAEQDG